MTVNRSALVETFIQLSNFRQYAMAESLLATCTREQVESLLGIADRAFSQRLIYSLEKQLKRGSEAMNKSKSELAVELIKICNVWCKEGHRSAIRCVLMELKAGELTTLSHMPGLDGEVYSMLREYDSPGESISVGCSY